MIHSTAEIIDDLKQGKMVVMVDDIDRENEGDIILLSSFATPEKINWIIRHACGQVCVTLTNDMCERLSLKLQKDGHKRGKYHDFAPNFTFSFESSSGIHTGVSAADRAKSIADAISPSSVPSDIIVPGHMFGLKSKTGGVLERKGHTEAGYDLARLCGHTPSSVIAEVLNEDGTMARRDNLEIFCRKHDLKLGTVEDLVQYREEHDI